MAMNSNRTVGHNNMLPWNCPADMAHFRRMTSKQIVIMGRKTWDSLPDSVRPLPNRTNIIIGSNLQAAKPSTRNDTTVLATANIKEAISWVGAADAWVIGGASIFQALLPIIQEVHLTVLNNNNFEGDTKMPDFEQDYNLVGITVLDAAEHVNVYRYVRKDVSKR